MSAHLRTPLAENGQEYDFLSVDAPGKTKADNVSGYELGNAGIIDQFHAIALALVKRPLVPKRKPPLRTTKRTHLRIQHSYFFVIFEIRSVY